MANNSNFSGKYVMTNKKLPLYCWHFIIFSQSNTILCPYFYPYGITGDKDTLHQAPLNVDAAVTTVQVILLIITTETVKNMLFFSHRRERSPHSPPSDPLSPHLPYPPLRPSPFIFSSNILGNHRLQPINWCCHACPLRINHSRM